MPDEVKGLNFPTDELISIDYQKDGNTLFF